MINKFLQRHCSEMAGSFHPNPREVRGVGKGGTAGLRAPTHKFLCRDRSYIDTSVPRDWREPQKVPRGRKHLLSITFIIPDMRTMLSLHNCYAPFSAKTLCVCFKVL